MKIFVGNGSYFKYSSTSFDYADIRHKTESNGSQGACFAASDSLAEEENPST